MKPTVGGRATRGDGMSLPTLPNTMSAHTLAIQPPIPVRNSTGYQFLLHDAANFDHQRVMAFGSRTEAELEAVQHCRPASSMLVVGGAAPMARTATLLTPIDVRNPRNTNSSPMFTVTMSDWLGPRSLV